MNLLKAQYDAFVADGFDVLGALVMVIDGQPEDERLQATVELLEDIGYLRSGTHEVRTGEYSVSTPGGQSSPAAMRAFIAQFYVGNLLIRYQPLHRYLMRGKSCSPHRPESDFRFADWYPAKSVATHPQSEAPIEDQIADEFPNAASAAQFLHELGISRSNTHRKLPLNSYFVAARHGDGQPSGIAFRGIGDAFFYDFYADDRFLMGPSGLLKEHRPTKRQLDSDISLAVDRFSF